MSIYENCVYTIIQSDKIVDLIREKQNTYIEKKVWRTAFDYLQEAKAKNQIMYLVLAPAETTQFLYAYAQIEDIEIISDEKSTKITFSSLKRFTNDSILKTQLKKTDGTYVDENYIRPYLLCKTESIIKDIEAEPDISILDLTKEEFIEPLKNEDFFSETEIKAIEFALSKPECLFSATELAKELNYKDYNAANLLVGNIGKKIAHFYNVDLSRTSNSPGWWRVYCDGGYIDDEFHWQIKQEFIDAIYELSGEPEPTYWLLPANDDNYDIEKAYLEYHSIDWHQTNSQIQENDVVYIYKTKPHQVVRFACCVKAVNKKSPNKKDRDCYKDTTPFENKDCYMTLEFTNRIEDVFPTMEGLKNNGISVIRGLMKIPETALKYIQEKEKVDYTAKRFNGSIPSDIPRNHWTLVGGDEEEIIQKEEKEAKSLSDAELFEKAKTQGLNKPKERATTTSTYVRNTYVAEASKRRAKGICQLCGKPAPFNDKNGNPYLESHHIIWLSMGGSDELNNTAALCPNCHKKMHIVNDEEDVKKLLDLNK